MTCLFVCSLLSRTVAQHMMQPVRAHHIQLAAKEQQERAKKAAEQPAASTTTTRPSPAPKAAGLEPTSPANFRSVHNGNGHGLEDDFDAVHMSSAATAKKLGQASAADFDGWDDFDGLDDDDEGNDAKHTSTGLSAQAEADRKSTRLNYSH